MHRDLLPHGRMPAEPPGWWGVRGKRGGWNPFFCAVAVISVGGSEPCLEAEKWAPPSFWRARGVLTVTPLCLYH